MDIVIGFTFETCRVMCMVFKNKNVFSQMQGRVCHLRGCFDCRQ